MSVGELYRDCPQCGAAMPVDPGFTTWCHACDWHVAGGVMPSTPEFSHPFARAQQRHADAAAAAMVERLAADPDRCEPVRSTVVATVLSLVIICGFLAGFVAWEIFAFQMGYWVFVITLTLLGLAVVWVCLPKPSSILRTATELTTEQYPALWEYVDLMAERCEAPAPQRLSTDVTQRAFVTVADWRARRLLHLGLPLWSGLTWDERNAVVAHELGHLCEKGAGAFVRWWARGIAIQGYRIVSPAAPRPTGNWWLDGMNILATTARTVAPVLELLAQGPLWVASMTDAAYARRRQENELLADRRGAQAIGTENMVRGVVCTMRSEGRRFAAQRALRNRQDIWAPLAALGEVPPREVARLIRLSELTGRRYDDSHPRDAQRIELLRRSTFHADVDPVPLDLQMRVDTEIADLQERLRKEWEGALYDD